MADEELERRVRELEHDHRLTRWYTGRVDRDLAEIAATQAEHTEALGRVESILTGHNGRFDSVESILTGHNGRFDSVESILTEHNGRFDSVESTLTEHNARFDSLDAHMRSLTQMVGQLLRTPPASPDEASDD